MRQYTHLNSETIRLESDWNTKFFQTMHSPRAFSNAITANIILSVEKMLSIASKQIRQISLYKKV